MTPNPDKYAGVNPENEKSMQAFFTECRINNKSERSIEAYESYLLKYARFLGNKRFENATESDVQQYFENINLKSSTQQTVKIVLKLFYRFLFKLEVGERLPDSVRWLKSKTKRQKEKEIDIEAERLKVIEPEEYQKLIDSTGDLQLKAIMEIGFWYGPRLGETLSMNVSGVKRTKGGTEITVLQSKTKPRHILILDAEHYPKHLMNLLDNHPQKNNPDAAMFINMNTDHRVFGTRLTVNNIDRKFVRLVQSVFGDKRRIVSHMLRHTAITRDCDKGMPWGHTCTKYGLSKNSRMREVYDHTGQKEYETWIKEKYDVKEEKTDSYNELLKQKEKIEQEKNEEIQNLKLEIKKQNTKQIGMEAELNDLKIMVDGLINSVLSRPIKKPKSG